MSDIHYTNMNDRWDRFARAQIVNERPAKAMPEPVVRYVDGTNTLSSQACLKAIAKMRGPFDAPRLFAAVEKIYPEAKFDTVRSWLTNRACRGEFIVVEHGARGRRYRTFRKP